MEIYALGCKKGSGKDTAAKLLRSYIMQSKPQAQIMHRSFAYPLKKTVELLYTDVESPEYYEEYPLEKEKFLEKYNRTVRDIWKDIGMLLRGDHTNVFPEWVLDQAVTFKADVLIVSDLRFPNEWDALKAAGAKLIRVDSGGRVENTDTHISENSLTDDLPWDYVLDNTGELGALHLNVVKMYGELNSCQ